MKRVEADTPLQAEQAAEQTCEASSGSRPCSEERLLRPSCQRLRLGDQASSLQASKAALDPTDVADMYDLSILERLEKPSHSNGMSGHSTDGSATEECM